jgi:hypothetical protein
LSGRVITARIGPHKRSTGRRISWKVIEIKNINAAPKRQMVELKIFRGRWSKQRPKPKNMSENI